MLENTKFDVTMVNEAELLTDTFNLIPQLLDYPQNENEQLVVQNAMFVLIKEWCILLSDMDKVALSSEQARTVGLAFADIVTISTNDEEE